LKLRGIIIEEEGGISYTIKYVSATDTMAYLKLKIKHSVDFLAKDHTLFVGCVPLEYSHNLTCLEAYGRRIKLQCRVRTSSNAAISIYIPCKSHNSTINLSFEINEYDLLNLLLY